MNDNNMNSQKKDSKKLSHLKLKENKQISKKESARFILFSILFFFILLDNSYIKETYDQNTYFNSIISDNNQIWYVNYSDLVNISLSKTITRLSYFSGTFDVEYDKNLYFNITFPLKIFTEMRITQRRVNLKSSDSNIWIVPIEYNNTNFGRYNFDSKTNGFKIYLPTVGQRNITTIKQLLQLIFKTDPFFSICTQKISIDFGFLNPNSKIISYYNKEFEIFPSGDYKEVTSIKSFHYEILKHLESTSKLSIRIIYMILLGFYFISIIIDIYYEIKNSNRENELQDGFENNTASTSSKSVRMLVNSVNTTKDKLINYLHKILTGLKTYFSKTGTILNIIAIILNIVAFEIYFNLIINNRMISQLNNITELEKNETINLEKKDALIDQNDYNQQASDLFHQFNDICKEITDDFESYQNLCAIIALINCFKMFTIIINYSKSLTKFFNICQKIIMPLFNCLIMMFVIVLNYVFLLRNFYGSHYTIYSDLYVNMVDLFGTLLGNEFRKKNQINNESFEFYFIFQFTFNFIIVFIMVNTILVVVKNEFSKLNDEKFENIKKEENYFGLNDYSIFFKIEQKFNLIYKKYLFFRNKEQFYKKQIEDQEFERNIKNDIELYPDINYDLNFSNRINDDENIQEENKVEAEKEKLKTLRNQKFAKILWKSLFILAGIVSFIYLTSKYFQSDENYFISDSIESLLNKEYKTNENSKLRLKELSNINQVLYYLIHIFPNLFEKKYYETANSTIMNPVIRSNYFLVNNTMRITIRKRKKNLEFFFSHFLYPTTIMPVFDYDLDDSDMEEYKNYRDEKGNWYNYSEKGSYLNKGGYVFYLPPLGENSNITSFLFNSYMNGFISDDTNSIVIDFLLVNPLKSNKFVYCLLVFQQLNNGKMTPKLLISPFKRFNVSNSIDLGLIGFLAGIWLLIFFQMIHFIRKLNDMRISYNIWYSLSISNKFPKSLLTLRSIKKPEFIRKIVYLFNIKNLLYLCYFSTSLAYFSYLFFRQINIFLIENKAILFEMELHDITITESWEINTEKIKDYGIYLNESINLYLNYGTLTLLPTFASAFMIAIFHENLLFIKHIRIMVNAIIITIKEIHFIMFVFFAILFSFALYAHLIAGRILKDFSSFSQSVRTLFAILYNMTSVDFYIQTRYSFIFFSLILLYVILQKFLIMNIIFAYIYNSFEKSNKIEKEDQKIENEISLVSFFKLTFSMLNKKNKKSIGLKSHLNLSQNAIRPEVFFNKMGDSIRSSLKDNCIYIWASSCSEIIRLESENRNSLKEMCDKIISSYFSSQSANKYFNKLSNNLKLKCLEYEIRKRYWFWFKIGFNYLNKYDNSFNRNINNKNERLKSREEKIIEELNNNKITNDYIEDLKNKIEENEKDKEYLKKKLKNVKLQAGLFGKKSNSPTNKNN